MNKNKSRTRLGVPDPSLVRPTFEREQKGAFAEVRTYEFDPGGAGEAPSPSRRMARALRDLNASVATRLAKEGLNGDQLMAATLFERDHELARLEPKLTVNLRSLGGGGRAADDLPVRVQDARNRDHRVRALLRQGGVDLAAVVEAVVLSGIAVTTVRAARDTDRRAAKARTMATLEIGLNLLAAHYRGAGRMA